MLNPSFLAVHLKLWTWLFLKLKCSLSVNGHFTFNCFCNKQFSKVVHSTTVFPVNLVLQFSHIRLQLSRSCSSLANGVVTDRERSETVSTTTKHSTITYPKLSQRYPIFSNAYFWIHWWFGALIDIGSGWLNFHSLDLWAETTQWIQCAMIVMNIHQSTFQYDDGLAVGQLLGHMFDSFLECLYSFWLWMSWCIPIAYSFLHDGRHGECAKRCSAPKRRKRLK